MLTLYPLLLAVAINTAPTNEPRFNEAIEGSWDAHFRPSMVQLNVRVERDRIANFGRAFSILELTDLRRDRRAIGFEMRRDAGTFRFDGVTKDLRATGTFSFTPSTGFKRSLEKIGMKGAERHQMLTLAMHDVTLDDLRILQRTVHGKLTLPEVVRMLDHGATPHFVRDLSGVGFSKLTSNTLIRTRDHGVDADYIRGLRAAGLILSLDEYIKARDSGVTLAYVNELREVGLRDLCIGEYMKLRDHDVTAEFANSLFEMGYTNLDLDDLIRLRGQGITAAYARSANKLAGEVLSIDELIRSRSHGDY